MTIKSVYLTQLINERPFTNNIHLNDTNIYTMANNVTKKHI